MSAVMIASRTRGVCFRLQRCRQRRNGLGPAAERARGGPARVGVGIGQGGDLWRQNLGRRFRRMDGCGSRLMNGICLTHSMIAAAISSIGRTNSAPPFFTSSPGMPQTTARDFGLGDGAAALLAQPASWHRLPSSPMPVISTPIRLGRVIMLERARHHALDARMPGIIALRRNRHRIEAEWPRRDDDIRIAAADIDRAGSQR